MKIAGIDDDPKNTNMKQISFFTDPPITQDVFDIYSEMVGSQNIFTLKNSLLITSVTGIPKEYLDQTEEHLSDAVRQIERAKDNKEKSHQSLLERFEKETGRPAGESPYS